MKSLMEGWHKSVVASGLFVASLGLFFAQAAGASEKTYLEIKRVAPVMSSEQAFVAPIRQEIGVPARQDLVVLEQPVVVEKSTRSRKVKVVEDTVKIPVEVLGEGADTIFLCAPPGGSPRPRAGW